VRGTLERRGAGARADRRYGNAAEARDASDVLDLVADDYEDAQGFDRAQLRNFLRGYFLAHPKIELLVNIESLEFPADGWRRRKSPSPVSRSTIPIMPAQGGIPPRGQRLESPARGPVRLAEPICQNRRQILAFRETPLSLRLNRNLPRRNRS
jgi:hypothetical protein